MNKLLKTDELAMLLGVEQRTAKRWAEQGVVTGQKVGGTWRFWADDFPPPGTLYTVEQAARLFGVHPKTLANWRERGYITADDLYQLGDKYVRVKQSCIDAILSGRTYPDPRRKEHV